MVDIQVVRNINVAVALKKTTAHQAKVLDFTGLKHFLKTISVFVFLID
tara:strand:+ start:337 stop:480 length:144 start_codon:yes stop_codon:yes gene_type:complete